MKNLKTLGLAISIAAALTSSVYAGPSNQAPAVTESGKFTVENACNITQQFQGEAGLKVGGITLGTRVAQITVGLEGCVSQIYFTPSGQSVRADGKLQGVGKTGRQFLLGVTAQGATALQDNGRWYMVTDQQIDDRNKFTFIIASEENVIDPNYADEYTVHYELGTWSK
ncbi:TPA: hypothetical protein ACWQJL_003121 [Escherichia coli]